MASQISVPSIAGGYSNSWRQDFEPYVSRWSGRNCPRYGLALPLTGSMGVRYSVREDLTALWGRLSGDKAAIADYLQSTYGVSEGKIEALFLFYTWVSSDQPYFFLRKGKKVLGLYRKTSGYLFAPQLAPEGPSSFCHRFDYEFVRDTTPTESSQSPTHYGRVPPAVFMASADIPETRAEAAPVTLSLDDMVAQLVRIRGAVATLTAEIDAALGRFSTTSV